MAADSHLRGAIEFHAMKPRECWLPSGCQADRPGGSPALVAAAIRTAAGLPWIAHLASHASLRGWVPPNGAQLGPLVGRDSQDAAAVARAGSVPTVTASRPADAAPVRASRWGAWSCQCAQGTEHHRRG